MISFTRAPATVLIGCAAALAGGLAAPAAGVAGGHQVQCTGTIAHTTLDGGVYVAPGEHCVLDGDTVWGGVTVNGAIEATNTAVHGGFVIDGGSAPAPLCGDSVDGGLYVTHVNDANASFVFGDGPGCAGPSVSGGVDFSSNPSVGLLQLAGATVSGQLKDSTNGDAQSILSNDTVTGSARCVGDAHAPIGTGDRYSANTGCPTA